MWNKKIKHYIKPSVLRVITIITHNKKPFNRWILNLSIKKIIKLELKRRRNVVIVVQYFE